MARQPGEYNSIFRAIPTIAAFSETFQRSNKRRFAQKLLCSLRASTAPFQNKWGPPSGIDGGPT